MSKADLKAAMESLQVNKPLRLSASAPAFKTPPPVPQDVTASEDMRTSLVPSTSSDESGSRLATQKPNSSTETDSVSQVRAASQDANMSGDADLHQDQKSSQVQFGSTDLLISRDTVSSQDVDVSKVEAGTFIPRASQPRRATEQDRAVTEAVSLKSRLSTGYTRVPNSVLMEMVSGDLSRNEMKIILLIARMTISFNRTHVPLSKGVIGRMTGVQGRSVLDALQTLQEAGLIEKRTGDCNSPNKLRLIFDPFPESNVAQVPKISRDAAGTTDAQGTKGRDENSTYKKDNSETIELRKKISLSSLSESLRKYFSELKPRRKREVEFEAFEELRTDYSEEQIEDCLRLLRARGLPHSGAVCHSPMAYLAKAIAQVLPEAKAKKERQELDKKRARNQVEEERRHLEQQLQDESHLVERAAAFQMAFPTIREQTDLIAKYSMQFPLLSPGGPVLRNLAVAMWWEETRSNLDAR